MLDGKINFIFASTTKEMNCVFELFFSLKLLLHENVLLKVPIQVHCDPAIWFTSVAGDNYCIV